MSVVADVAVIIVIVGSAVAAGVFLILGRRASQREKRQ